MKIKYLLLTLPLLLTSCSNKYDFQVQDVKCESFLKFENTAFAFNDLSCEVRIVRELSNRYHIVVEDLDNFMTHYVYDNPYLIDTRSNSFGTKFGFSCCYFYENNYYYLLEYMSSDKLINSNHGSFYLFTDYSYVNYNNQDYYFKLGSKVIENYQQVFDDLIVSLDSKTKFLGNWADLYSYYYRFTDDYCIIDVENKTITVKAYKSLDNSENYINLSIKYFDNPNGNYLEFEII